MRADMTRVRQILFNLLSNAGKFTENGAVRLEVARQSTAGKDWLQFRVTDTGIGMSPDQMARLFQEFTQVDASTTRKYGGTGLGLAISRRFSDMMGGELTVDSAPGVGSTFTLRLPALVETPAEAEGMSLQSAGAAAPGPATSANTVLVIDDDPIVRDLMTRLLSKEGYAVVGAADGHEGLALAKTVRPAVVTLDVLMPGLDGWAVLAALKNDPDLADIPVVMVTMTDDKRRAYALGAADYIVKPVDPSRLAALFNKLTSPGGAPVLVVDDEPTTRTMMARVLAHEGCDVVVAENGCMALQRLAERTPRLILTDLMMPEMDGFELIDHVRQNPAWAHIPIVVATAKDISRGRPPTPEPVPGESPPQVGLRPRRPGGGDSSAVADLPTAGTSEPIGEHDAHDPPRRRPRNEPEDVVSPAAQPRIRRDHRCRRPGGRRDGAHAAARPHPDGHEPARDRWMGGDTHPEGRRRTRSIPIIALTAHAMLSDRQKALAAGCDDYDSKPIEFERLTAKIERMLNADLLKCRI